MSWKSDLQREKLTNVFFLNHGGSKGIVIFFLTDKVHGPFIQSNRKVVCFFFPRSGKEKFMSHSFRIWWVFLYFFWKWGVFFFFSTFLGVFFVFFFSCKSSHVIHSFDLKAVFFFSSLEKKNTAFSFIQSIFSQNVKKMNFYRKKKNTIPLLRLNVLNPESGA